ncbi:ATP-dependent RNA helicase dbp6 [Metarhizium rileyi]|uniref:ATP-dependent RNA helicase n=1 Tax=Metarhizium rileyi (strain RCEF 4871) TaxID=1649241 RepID=A0A5C6G9A3_METRR|nr:ATP-dependent RNA helicase dbp6 [Metarhizium rileyi]
MYARYVPPSKGAKATAPAEPSLPTHSSAFKPDVAASKLVEGICYARYVPGAKVAAKSSPAPVSTPKKIQYFDDDDVDPTPKRKRGPATAQQEPESKKARRSKDLTAPHDNTAAIGSQPGEKKRKNRRKRKQRTKAGDSSDDSDEEPKHITPRSAPTLLTLQEKSEEAAPQQNKDGVGVAQDNPPIADEPSSRDNDVDMAEAPVPEVEVQVKEKKPKREKKKKQVKEVAEEYNDDRKEAARHRTVLERKSKSIKLAAKVVQTKEDESDKESVESHGLEPLPQPAPVPESDSKPTYETLPPWLSNPIRVAQNTKAPFTDLGILPRPSRILADKGYSEAFAVQTAAIPLLLPTSKQRPGDVLVSAATGSGKTLAYALPIVRDISNGVITRFRALVVLPTRELVKQAQEVFEICAKAYEGEDRKRVRIGVAIGNQSLKMEQEAFIERESRYDPEAYLAIQEHREQRAEPPTAGVDDAHNLDSADTDPRLGPWKGEVVDFSSKIDVLICTPGRLVEHVEQTVGFSLDYVRWLVVDEADKLLAQSFQGWLDLVLEKFQVNRFGARDFPDMACSGVRKVVLSATLTRDLSLLNQLALRRPRLIVLDNDGAVQVAEHTLPVGLREFAVRVHETNLKPLYLLHLLKGPHMNVDDGNGDSFSTLKEDEDSSDTSSDSDSSDSDSDATSDSNTSDGEGTPPSASETQMPISLIFTKSNEAALRLSRLLTLLDSSLTSHISTLTSTMPSHVRRKVLRAFTTPSSPIRLIIASDLVARGIDIPKLGHVINYDLPASVAGYVHRVGRTARAGRSGRAWTLIGDEESGWFWGKIAKNPTIRRAQKVERTRVEEMAEERIQEYQAALGTLGKEALELRRSK